MTIDWTKSPEGTIAFCNGYWLTKASSGDFLCQPVNNGWQVPDFKPWKQDGFIYKKDDLYPQDQGECDSEIEP